MIEEKVYAYLSEKLSVPIRFEKRPNDAAPYCLIQRTSGTDIAPGVCGCTFAIQSYGTNIMDAGKINDDVKAAMRLFAGEKNISSCVLNTDLYQPDLNRKEYRYQAVFNIVYLY